MTDAAKPKRPRWTKPETHGWICAYVELLVDPAFKAGRRRPERISKAQDLAVQRGWLAEDRRKSMRNPYNVLAGIADLVEEAERAVADRVAETRCSWVNAARAHFEELPRDVAPAARCAQPPSKEEVFQHDDVGPRGQTTPESAAALGKLLVASLALPEVRDALVATLVAEGFVHKPKPAPITQAALEEAQHGPLPATVLAAAQRRDSRPFVSSNGDVKAKPKVVILGLKPNQQQDIRSDFGAASELVFIDANGSHDRAFQHACSADLVIGMVGWVNASMLQKAQAGAKRGNDRYRACTGTVGNLRRVLTINLAELSAQRKDLP